MNRTRLKRLSETLIEQERQREQKRAKQEGQARLDAFRDELAKLSIDEIRSIRDQHAAEWAEANPEYVAWTRSLSPEEVRRNYLLKLKEKKIPGEPATVNVPLRFPEGKTYD